MACRCAAVQRLCIKEPNEQKARMGVFVGLLRLCDRRPVHSGRGPRIGEDTNTAMLCRLKEREMRGRIDETSLDHPEMRKQTKASAHYGRGTGQNVPAEKMQNRESQVLLVLPPVGPWSSASNFHFPPLGRGVGLHTGQKRGSYLTDEAIPRARSLVTWQRSPQGADASEPNARTVETHALALAGVFSPPSWRLVDRRTKPAMD